MSKKNERKQDKKRKIFNSQRMQLSNDIHITPMELDNQAPLSPEDGEICSSTMGKQEEEIETVVMLEGGPGIDQPITPSESAASPLSNDTQHVSNGWVDAEPLDGKDVWFVDGESTKVVNKALCHKGKNASTTPPLVKSSGQHVSPTVSNPPHGQMDQFKTGQPGQSTWRQYVSDDTYITDSADPKQYQWHKHGPHDFAQDVTEGYYQPKAPYSGPTPARRRWDRICPEDDLRDSKNDMAQMTQHIMEGRSLMFDCDEVTLWAKWVNGATFGRIEDRRTGEIQISDDQQLAEAETIQDAEEWYKSRALSRRLRRLRPMHRLYRQVHLFVRGRAPRPTAQLGSAPKDNKERQLVWTFCSVNHQGNKVKLSPKSGLAEYEAWWNRTRSKRTMNVQQRCNIYVGRARRLRSRLGQISPKDQRTQQLHKLIWDFNLKGWPEELSDHMPQSQVEKDTFFDWLFASERQIRRFLPSEYYGPKYRY